MKIIKMTMVSLLLLMIALPLYAGGRLTYYCSTDIPWCELMKKEFEKRTGIRVSMTRASSGETLTKIRAEKSNPKGDVWWGGQETRTCRPQRKGFLKPTTPLS